MSPASPVPLIFISSSAAAIAARTNPPSRPSADWRRSRIMPDTQPRNVEAGLHRPRSQESSRCVWALTSAGMMTASPRSTRRIASPPAPGLSRALPKAAIRPPSTATHPSRIGGLVTGRTQDAR